MLQIAILKKFRFVRIGFLILLKIEVTNWKILLIALSYDRKMIR